jgi:hypothetical protein
MAVSEVQAEGGGLDKLLPMGIMLTSYSFLLPQHTVKCMLKNTSKHGHDIVSMHDITFAHASRVNGVENSRCSLNSLHSDTAIFVWQAGHCVILAKPKRPWIYNSIPSVPFSIKFSFVDRTSSRQYCAKLLLQIRIKPGSYTVGPSTVASHMRNGSGPIDPNFSDDELEWMTNYECVHYIYGILIKLE